MTCCENTKEKTRELKDMLDMVLESVASRNRWGCRNASAAIDLACVYDYAKHRFGEYFEDVINDMFVENGFATNSYYSKNWFVKRLDNISQLKNYYDIDNEQIRGYNFRDDRCNRALQAYKNRRLTELGDFIEKTANCDSWHNGERVGITNLHDHLKSRDYEGLNALLRKVADYIGDTETDEVKFKRAIWSDILSRRFSFRAENQTVQNPFPVDPKNYCLDELKPMLEIKLDHAPGEKASPAKLYEALHNIFGAHLQQILKNSYLNPCAVLRAYLRQRYCMDCCGDIVDYRINDFHESKPRLEIYRQRMWNELGDFIAKTVRWPGKILDCEGTAGLFDKLMCMDSDGFLKTLQRISDKNFRDMGCREKFDKLLSCNKYGLHQRFAADCGEKTDVLATAEFRDCEIRSIAESSLNSMQEKLNADRTDQGNTVVFKEKPAIRIEWDEWEWDSWKADIQYNGDSVGSIETGKTQPTYPGQEFFVGRVICHGKSYGFYHNEIRSELQNHLEREAHRIFGERT